MANRVNVNITARDLTRGTLARMRTNFSALGADIDRSIGRRTRTNFGRLSQSASQARRDLNAMRGAIPDDEFARLDAALQRAQRRLSRGFNNVGDRGFQRIQRDLRAVQMGFQNLDEQGEIRVRVDTSALRRADARLTAWRRDQARNGVRVPVRPDVDRGAWRRLGRFLVAPLRITFSMIGGVLSDGVGQGIISGFKTAAPVGIAILAVALTAFVSMLGAALAGLLVTALGLGFIGIGLLSAAKSDEVKDQWEATLDSLNEKFKTVGEPLVDTMLNGMDIIDRMSTRAAPALREAFAGAAPAVDTFFERIAQGFEHFGEAAFDPIMDAWSTFAPIFGEVFDGFMTDLGENFGDMANIVRDHSVEIQLALTAFFKIISGLVEVVNFLANTWIFLFRSMNSAIAIVINMGLIPFAEAALNAMGVIVKAMEFSIGKIPGFGDALKGAGEAFDVFKEHALDQLRAVGENADQANNRLDKLNKVRKLQGDISQLQGKLKTARDDLARTTNKKARAKVEANIAQLQRQLNKARAELNSIDGKTANTYLITWHRNKNYGGNSVTGGRAHGGVIGAAATGGVRGNLTMVGEQGPELVRLPSGSNVRSNPDTRRLLAQGARGSVASNLVIKSSGRRADDMLLEILREAIHQRGGDPVKVLGGR